MSFGSWFIDGDLEKVKEDTLGWVDRKISQIDFLDSFDIDIHESTYFNDNESHTQYWVFFHVRRKEGMGVFWFGDCIQGQFVSRELAEEWVEAICKEFDKHEIKYGIEPRSEYVGGYNKENETEYSIDGNYTKWRYKVEDLYSHVGVAVYVSLLRVRETWEDVISETWEDVVSKRDLFSESVLKLREEMVRPLYDKTESLIKEHGWEEYFKLHWCDWNFELNYHTAHRDKFDLIMEKLSEEYEDIVWNTWSEHRVVGSGLKYHEVKDNFWV